LNVKISIGVIYSYKNPSEKVNLALFYCDVFIKQFTILNRLRISFKEKFT